MRLTRRRFLTIAAAAAAAPGHAVAAQTWRGRALGADVSLTIDGPREVAERAIAEIPPLLGEVERLFSLYDSSSALSTLNRTGTLAPHDPRFMELVAVADRGHRMTQGLFDPSVQPLWLAMAQGEDLDGAAQAVGWDRVRWNDSRISLAAGQALTFNGIAQGFATDLVTARLKTLGLREALVNIGEYSALGGPWRLGLHDPNFGVLGMRTIRNSAIATSSPSAMQVGHRQHILHPAGRALWSTVSVEAANATLADCLSTALCLAPMSLIRQVRQMDGVQRITLVDPDGNLTSV